MADTKDLRKPTFKYPKECTLIPATDIDVSGRARQDYGDLQELADNIMEVGLIHPPTLTKKGNRLIAGGRRTATIVGPLECDLVPVVFRESMPLHMVRELELHENIKRLGMTWMEQVLLILDTHLLKKKSAVARQKTWYAKETGQLLGKSGAHVSHALLVGKALRAGDKEVLECKSFGDAVKLLLKRKADEAIAFRAQQTGLLVPNKPQLRVGTGAVEVNLDDPNHETPLSDESKPLPTQLIEIDYNLGTFHYGDFREVMKSIPDASIDHVVTDPPYGIDMANLDTYKDIDSIRDTHDVEQNISMFEPFLREAYRVIKNGFCVFWYDLDHHEKLQAIAESVGFKVQRWPLVWIKTHACRNSAPDKNFTKSTEVAMVLRKGSASIQKPATKNWVMADGSVERKLYDHPFVKPFEVWDFILSHIAYRGQSILDPFAGQMSGPRAFINCGMVPHAIELDPLHFVKGVDSVEKLVKQVAGGQVTFQNDPRPAAAKDIKVHKPTTPDDLGVEF